MDYKAPILLTYFEPFGGETENAAALAAALLPDEIDGRRIVKLQIPVTFGGAAAAAIQKAEELSEQGTAPAAVIGLGQAAGRAKVTPEMVGINLRIARIPDNAGAAPEHEPVVPGGPDALFATAFPKNASMAIKAAGLPGDLSLTAGAYVCNDLLYSLLYRFRDTPVRAGFIHVPVTPRQALTHGNGTLPSLDSKTASKAILEALRAVSQLLPIK
ncbi:MAG: pyroglutamyl-peptidase I [Clostridia bacterium]|nr:pyroglutamyl-peptidase I [Clostridia bacterium]